MKMLISCQTELNTLKLYIIKGNFLIYNVKGVDLFTIAKINVQFH